ncbi:hypothetical protein FS749_010555, partial [Ceratobasidium sp. UAMH 11750]
VIILSIAWAIVFLSSLLSPLLLGFGGKGVRPGSRAAKYQSRNYGGYTPRRGPFAILTRVGMVGVACLEALLSAALTATVFTALVWVIRRYIEEGW